jgi:peroxiredoxin
MKKVILSLSAITLFWVLASSFKNQTAPGLKVGDLAPSFNLKNIDGKMYNLADEKNAKGFIVIFTCNHCPYAKAYDSRKVELDKKYKALGYPVIAINPNDAEKYPTDSYDSMVYYAAQKGYTFPYLHDESQEVAREYGATKTPHIYILKKTKKGLRVEYVGAIDDNYKDPSAVKEKYVESAVDALLKGKKVKVTSTKAIGCSIKWKA